MNEQKIYREGVGAFLINKKQQVFLGKRIDAKNAWQMPQGGIDSNETPEDAILRELKEEIGNNNVKILGKTRPLEYDFPKDIYNNTFKSKYHGQKLIWFALLFLGNDEDINLYTQTTPEFCEWKWENPHKIVDIIIDFKKKLYKDLLNEMKSMKILNIH